MYKLQLKKKPGLTYTLTHNSSDDVKTLLIIIKCMVD